jgi:hypothetical protein
MKIMFFWVMIPRRLVGRYKAEEMVLEINGLYGGI